MSNLIDRCHNESANDSLVWEKTPERTYACLAMVCLDEDGGYFAYATKLPGVVGEGETFQEAVNSIREGFESVLSDYLSTGSIPWQEEVTHEQGVLVSLAIRVND